MTPVRLRLECDEGEKTVTVRKGDKGNRFTTGATNWKELAATVEAYHPSRVEALDEGGDVIGVWAFPEPESEPTTIPAAYLAATTDTADVGTLKAFGAMLAEAHKQALNGLVGVVNLQSQHFAEERKAMSSALMNMDRIVQRSSRIAGRKVRVADPDEEDDDRDEEPADTNGAFVTELVTSMLKKQVADATAPATNGAAKAEGTS